MQIQLLPCTCNGIRSPEADYHTTRIRFSCDLRWQHKATTTKKCRQLPKKKTYRQPTQITLFETDCSFFSNVILLHTNNVYHLLSIVCGFFVDFDIIRPNKFRLCSKFSQIYSYNGQSCSSIKQEKKQRAHKYTRIDPVFTRCPFVHVNCPKWSNNILV